ncbi:MAG TPA: hypothetical protein PKO41_02240 [Dokdonella sp.]|uniref:hypothetical protein n=1 Tax=Dokdonella sp. TaxID=2291710 RepID=UPI0025B9872E|nr:hypothetical protein [Dokdonella sp.]MBX3692464.1 hypothetical protein [Dokdonella sp.]MCW5568988.1 hypothetical protein [Dokdonella sp.]HNR91222.1 hypothetical protein [Dokdonella sp.]
MRRLTFAIAMMMSVLGVLAWAAGLDPRAPLAPAQERVFKGADLQPVMGSTSVVADSLRIEAVNDEEATALQSVALDGLAAADYSFLRYRFLGFPQTLELSLIFRRADSLDEVRVVSLPWPGHGDAWFDLSAVPEWQGRIVELGFAQFPTPQVVSASQPFEPFTLEAVALVSPSWKGELAALSTDWLGQWPWSQRSVHALGRDTDTPRARSIVLCIALVVALALVWGGALLRWRGRRLVTAAAIAIAAGWLLLDLHWQAGLQWRHQTTRALYAGLQWPAQEARAADADILAAAKEIERALAREADTARILVHAGGSYEQLRLAWHLLPRNVAVLPLVVEASVALPPGTLVVVYNYDEWRLDAAAGRLRGGGLDWPAEPVAHGHGWILARITEDRR